MAYYKDHPKCWTCARLNMWDRDNDEGKAVMNYDCGYHDIEIEDPMSQYCSEHISDGPKGGKHDVAPI